MFRRQTTGSVVCPFCHRLVGVNDEQCFHCGRSNPGMWGFAPLLRRFGYNLDFSKLVVWSCAALYLATLAVDPGGVRIGSLFSLFSPSGHSLLLFGMSGSVPVFELGRWWTLLSAAWLHGGLLHILFNMIWVRQLATTTASEYGGCRVVIIYTLSSVTGFFLSSLSGALGILPWPLQGATFTIGASAPIFGLLGALVYAGKKGSSALGRQAWSFAIILFVLGLAMPRIDNWAHLGGFLGGYWAAKWLNPLQPENTRHLVAAFGCIALTVLSIVLSIVYGLQFF